jgi:hypothetical protein
MQNLSYVAWMLLFPVAMSVCSYLDSRQPGWERASVEARGISALITVVIWFVVGAVLWNDT